jgi:hypothetical protein
MKKVLVGEFESSKKSLIIDNKNVLSKLIKKIKKKKVK